MAAPAPAQTPAQVAEREADIKKEATPLNEREQKVRTRVPPTAVLVINGCLS